MEPFCWMLTVTQQYAAFVLVVPLTVAGKVLQNSVCLASRPVVCPGVFLELDH